MSLAERISSDLPKMPRREWLLTKGKKIISNVRVSITKWGLFGSLLMLMIIFSGFKLLWSSEFPIGWWVVMGILLLEGILRDKIVWPKDKYIDKKLEKEQIQSIQVKEKEEENVSA